MSAITVTSSATTRRELVALFASCALGLALAVFDIYWSLAGLGAIMLAVATLINPLAGLTALLVLSPARTLIATESVVQFPLDLGQILFVVLLLSWLVHRTALHRKLPKLTWSPVLTALFPFLMVTALSGFYAPSLSAWLTEWLKWVIVAVLIVFVMIEHVHWRWIAFALTLSGVSQALIGLYTFLGGSGAEHLRINEHLFRAFGTFGQPNPFGGFMGLIAPIAFGLSVGYLLQWWRNRAVSFSMLLSAWYAIAFGILSVALFASWSRGAWLGLIVSMGTVLIALPRRLWQSASLAVLLGGLALIVWQADLLPSPISDRIENATQELFTLSDVRGVDVTTENYAVIERLAHWQTALNMVRSHPYFGVGFGNYDAAYQEHRLLNWPLSLEHAHNYYLNVFAEAGMIGLATYLTLFLWMILFAWRLRSHPDPVARGLGLGLLGMLVYLMIHSLTDNLYVNNIFIHLGVMLGLLATLYQQLIGQTRQR